jgi:hypothetical protein
LADKRAGCNGVTAKVRGQTSIVAANAWYKTTAATPEEPGYDLTARPVVSLAQDIEAQGTPEADEATQKLLDSAASQPWGEVKVYRG